MFRAQIHLEYKFSGLWEKVVYNFILLTRFKGTIRKCSLSFDRIIKALNATYILGSVVTRLTNTSRENV